MFVQSQRNKEGKSLFFNLKPKNKKSQTQVRQLKNKGKRVNIALLK